MEIEFSKQYMKDSKKAFKKYICEVDKTIKTQVVGDAIMMSYETRSEDRETRN
jgi:mRNA-degrading endonuclease YafQ of YafQ-DinJ toxin-antitoxin module